MKSIWSKKGFAEFSKGSFGNGGQNIYVSRKGVLQRIYNFDVNGDGYFDIPFSNSQSMGERPDIRIYTDINDITSVTELPTNGTFDAFVTDLTGDGTDDLIVACQNNGTHSDNCACIFFGSENGFCTDFCCELPVPDGIGVTAGDYDGTGKKSLCFVSNGFLRIFKQNERGFNACFFDEIKTDAAAVFTADINGDGYDDLFVKMQDESYVVFFGGKEGLKADNNTVICGSDCIKPDAVSSTEGRRGAYRGSRPTVVELKGEKYIFCAEKTRAVFYKYEKDKFEETFSFACNMPKYALSCDISGTGYNDLVILCFNNTEREETSFILWDGNPEDVSEIAIRGALTADFAITESGRTLAICQTGTEAFNEVMSRLIVFDGRNIKEIIEVPTADAQKLLFAKPYSDSGKTVIISADRERGLVRGTEDLYIYLGSEKGYTEDNRVELPGRSAVDMLLVDITDNGYPDALVVNCCENYPDADPGTWIYLNDKNGLNRNKYITLPTIRNHGTAIGDFSHSGYLDIATGGILNRELRIFHGGEWGYDIEHCTKIVFGPEPEKSNPMVEPIFENPITKGEEMVRMNTWGELRWLFTADLNGDGWLDLIVPVVCCGYLYILWGGPEGFSLKNSTRLNCDGAISITVADLNKNGYPDLIVGSHVAMKKSNPKETYITIYRGGKDGYKENRKQQLPAHVANSVTVGDFNGNGWLDIYATAYNNGRERDLNSYIYFNREGHFNPYDRKALYNHSGCGCIAADFNGDGYTDLAVAFHKTYGNHVGFSRIFWGGPEGLDDSRHTDLPTKGPHGMSNVDPGNIMDRSEKEYYISECYAVPANKATLYCEAEFTSTSYCEYEYRCADTETGIERAEWKHTEPGKAFYVNGIMQYRISLCAKSGCGTPRITEIRVEFE